VLKLNHAFLMLKVVLCRLLFYVISSNEKGFNNRFVIEPFFLKLID